jgi:hypothetical protein
MPSGRSTTALDIRRFMKPPISSTRTSLPSFGRSRAEFDLGGSFRGQVQEQLPRQILTAEKLSLHLSLHLNSQITLIE